MPDVAPPGTPDPQPAGQTGGSGTNKTLMIVGAIVLLVAVALIAFMVGKSKGEDDIKSQYEPGEPKYSAIYTDGQNAGQATGESEGQATGEAEGESSGQQKGKKVGLEQGEQQGEVTGANDVFDSFSGGWQVGDYYVVEIGEGSGGVDYTLASRQLIEQGESYGLCSDDSGTICAYPSPPQTGGSGGTNSDGE